MGVQLEALFGDSVSTKFIQAFDQTPLNIIPQDWNEQFDLAVVVTDIISSAKVSNLGSLL